MKHCALEGEMTTEGAHYLGECCKCWKCLGLGMVFY